MKQRELMILTGEREVGTIAALRGPGARGVLNLPSPYIRQACPGLDPGSRRGFRFFGEKQKTQRDFAEPVFPN